MMQLDNTFSYKAWATRKITASTFENIAEDTDKYKTVRITIDDVDAITISDGITPDIVGNIVLRLDHISATSDNASIEIKELMLEIGDKCNNWTDHTLNTEKALLATGIDIESKVITATADNFKIKNNLGQTTIEVDADGNLESNSLLVRNLDKATAEGTPFLTTINLLTGYMQFHYPLAETNIADNVAMEIGWDSTTNSIFRFYDQAGNLKWKAGSANGLVEVLSGMTETSITPIELYKCTSAGMNGATQEISTSENLTGATYYKKVVTQNKLSSVAYYSDAECENPLNGMFTPKGLPVAVISTEGKGSFMRKLYNINNGTATITTIIF